jgi:hypothetical protein
MTIEKDTYYDKIQQDDNSLKLPSSRIYPAIYKIYLESY